MNDENKGNIDRKEIGMKRQARKNIIKRQKMPQGIAGIVCILLFLTLIMTVKGVELREKSQEYTKQIEKLEEAKKEAEKTKKELQAREEYMKTDEYIKEVAKEKLNLVEKGEKIFKIEE